MTSMILGTLLLDDHTVGSLPFSMGHAESLESSKHKIYCFVKDFKAFLALLCPG